MSRTIYSLALVLAFHLSSFPAHSAIGKDSWKLIQQLPHHASFTFMDRDRNCHFGQVFRVNDHSVVVNTGKSQVAIEKSNLLYVQRGHFDVVNGPRLGMYSGRSAWADLLMFMPLLHQFPSLKAPMSVATANGKLRKGDLKEVTETAIVLRDSFGKETQVSKSQVSRVNYIQDKPLSDMEEYDWEELAMLRIFDPVLYPRLFHAGDTTEVPLYDRALPQDDSPLRCSQDSAP